MTMTIYDISQKAGVSIATVSRVINGSDKVKPSTRQKVSDVIEKYGYTPNAFARGMGLQSLHTAGILCADSSDLFLAKAVFYLEQELQANGYESLLCCTGYNLDLKKNYLDLILSKKIDGLILVGSHFIGTTEEENQYIKDGSDRVPIMLLNAAFDYPNVYCTLCDDETTMFETTKSMISGGIRDILYLYNIRSYSGIKKIAGFQRALQSFGIDEPQNYMRYYPYDSSDANRIAAFIEKTAEELHFQGMIAADDLLAVGGIKYAQKHNLIVPKDLSVIGYNNSILTTCCTPELTSVDNRLETLTHQLVQTLLGVLAGEEMPKMSVFSGKLIKRGSTYF